MSEQTVCRLGREPLSAGGAMGTERVHVLPSPWLHTPAAKAEPPAPLCSMVYGCSWAAPLHRIEPPIPGHTSPAHTQVTGIPLGAK